MSNVVSSPRKTAPAHLNPFTQEFLASKDPYPLLRELREHGPVCWIEEAQLWAITGYNEAIVVLNDPRLRTFLNVPDDQDMTGASAFIRAVRVANVLSSHGERHQRLRPLYAGLMIPKGIADMRPVAERTAGNLIDRVEARRSIDIVKEYGMPLVFEQISDALALPSAVRSNTWQWVEAFNAGIRDVTYAINDAVVLKAADEATVGLNACFGELVADRRSRPRDDMLDRMIRVAEKNGVSDEELCVNAWTLYIVVILGAANHDPAQFPAPERFDITRKTRPLSFGHGPHACVGQLFARMNIGVAYSTLFKRLPTLRLDDLDPPRTPAISGGLPSLVCSW
jgi:cytochrome P450